MKGIYINGLAVINSHRAYAVRLKIGIKAINYSNYHYIGKCLDISV